MGSRHRSTPDSELRAPRVPGLARLSLLLLRQGLPVLLAHETEARTLRAVRAAIHPAAHVPRDTAADRSRATHSRRGFRCGLVESRAEASRDLVDNWVDEDVEGVRCRRLSRHSSLFSVPPRVYQNVRGKSISRLSQAVGPSSSRRWRAVPAAGGAGACAVAGPAAWGAPPWSAFAARLRIPRAGRDGTAGGARVRGPSPPCSPGCTAMSRSRSSWPPAGWASWRGRSWGRSEPAEVLAPLRLRSPACGASTASSSSLGPRNRGRTCAACARGRRVCARHGPVALL
jgi:hypothetical protein